LDPGLVIGQPDAQGEPISMDDAHRHLFGVASFTDRCARNIQSAVHAARPVPAEARRQRAVRTAHDDARAGVASQGVRPPTRRARAAAVGGLEHELWLPTPAMPSAGPPRGSLSRSDIADGGGTPAQRLARGGANGGNRVQGDRFGSGRAVGRRTRTR